jgi:cytochrome c553
MFKRSLVTAPVLALSAWLPWGTAAAADVQAGEQIATQVCAACHGADGNSVVPTFPNLAGQVGGYVADQLALMKSGERMVPEMVAFVANLSPEDMANLGAFYAEQSVKPTSISESEVESAERGERLYRGGDQSRQIPACVSCHLPDGRGIPEAYPRVANQHLDYLKKQLYAYKDGERVSRGRIMNDIAFMMSRQQIEDVATYMYALKYEN